VRTLIYENRIEAGKVLSDKLKHYKDMTNLIVLGLPRGGVIVAAEVAGAIHADLDVIVVRKLGMPGYEEVAMGAIATGGVEVIYEVREILAQTWNTKTRHVA
jgi:putative phosphoribosyl transferase